MEVKERVVAVADKRKRREEKQRHGRNNRSGFVNNGIEVVGERSLEKDLIAVGEKVHVLIYRLYIFDDEKTYLMENSEMQEQDVFYI